MKVGELIDELSELDPNMQVHVSADIPGTSCRADYVDIRAIAGGVTHGKSYDVFDIPTGSALAGTLTKRIAEIGSLI